MEGVKTNPPSRQLGSDMEEVALNLLSYQLYQQPLPSLLSFRHKLKETLKANSDPLINSLYVLATGVHLCFFARALQKWPLYLCV